MDLVEGNHELTQSAIMNWVEGNHEIPQSAIMDVVGV